MLSPLSWILSACLQQGAAAPSSPPPRLIVLVVVDQLIPEQLQRLGSRLDGGFGRFLREGTVFWRATVDYANTETAPGHATIATGCYPAAHGIVGNMIYDRARRQVAYAVADESAHPLTTKGVDGAVPGVSAANLLVDALGDRLRAKDPGSKTVALGGKDRSAILLGGKKPDVVLWWDGIGGGFASSSAYGQKLPEFASVWNASWGDRASGWVWECELEGDFAPLGTAADDRAGESPLLGRAFPHRLPKESAQLPGAVFSTPLIDYFTLELANLALDSQQLGRDDSVDLLAISLSGCDVVGHGYGPDSLEVTDLLVRDDHELGKLFAQLDERVGRGRWIACLSADHGVLDLPEALAERQVGARRVKSAELAELREAVASALASSYPDVPLDLKPIELGFAFDEAAARAAGLDPKDVRAAIAAAALESPWVEDAYTLEELQKPDDPWLVLYARCRTAGRGPDVVLRPEPWLLFELPVGTSHGSPYPYDRRVPLCFLGGRVRAQQRFDVASPTDAVPTLLALLGLPVPGGLDGHALRLE